MSYYYFGVEIEVIAEPHHVQDPLLRRVYYEKLARALNRHGLLATADKLDGSRYCKHAEFYDSHWWITKDGSLKDPSYPRIPLEAVSPILTTAVRWEDEVDTFWRAWDDVFEPPDASSLCGSHIHVSRYPQKMFSLTQLKNIAIGVILFEPLVHELLPECRQDNKYCRRNTQRSAQLRNMGSDYGAQLWEVCRYISEEIEDTEELRDFMQENTGKREDRYVLWNFDNILPGESGSIEFRGGHGLRGPSETRKWIAFVVAFIHLCIETRYDDWELIDVSYSKMPGENDRVYLLNFYTKGCSIARSNPLYYMGRFWEDLNEAARFLDVREHLPACYDDMMGLYSRDCNDEFEGYDDDSSIMSKGEFQSSDSEFSDDKDPYDEDTDDHESYGKDSDEDSDSGHSYDYYSD
ncbi:putative amidoligase enzyme-domain-containing protein [Xylaria grammica]|nr:putative amidoligase enzyme-domain-containing protein [Xylaria grammica]